MRTLSLMVVLVAMLSCKSTEPRFLDRVLDPATDAATFEAAIQSVASEVLQLNYDVPYRLRFGGARRVIFEDGRQGVVALLRGRSAPCGTGLSLGHVDPPEWLAREPDLEGIVILSPEGRPLTMVHNGRTRLRVVDLDRDGCVDVLIRWSVFFDYQRPPFLVIHDLRRPGLPAMLSVSFNARAASEIRYPIADPEVKEPELIPGRWKLADSKGGYPCVVLETDAAGKTAEVARFRYSPATRRWEGPEKDESGFWTPNLDVWCGVSQTDCSAATR